MDAWDGVVLFVLGGIIGARLMLAWCKHVVDVKVATGEAYWMVRREAHDTWYPDLPSTWRKE